MYAVIKTGGKQYRVAEGQKIRVEKIQAEEGASIALDEVLMIAAGDKVTLGNPLVAGGQVMALVKAQGRSPKVEIVKFRRRKHYRKQMGHRQSYTELEVTKIAGPGIESGATSQVVDTAGATTPESEDTSNVVLEK